MRRIEPDERRARLAVRHGLAGDARPQDPAEVARDLVALHSTDAASVYLAAVARTPGIDVAALEHALYKERTLVRLLGMRRTVFVVPVELAPVVQAACTEAIAVQERRRLARFLEEGGIAADGDAWLRAVQAETLEALCARGEATAAELAGDVPPLREKLRFGAGKRWEGQVGVSTRVLFLLAAEGQIVRGRPRGSWTSSLYRWAPTAAWLPGGMPEVPVEAARTELVRQWLAAFGPGTLADIRWWTGWTAAEASRALAGVRPAEVRLDGATGFVLAGDLEPVPTPEPWVALLPALDSTVMGWTGRDWFLGDHGPALFDRSGNPGPTVWCDGRVVGGWVQRKDGQLALRLLEDIGFEAAAAVDAAAARLQAWLGDVRVTPRFRTPLERELSG